MAKGTKSVQYWLASLPLESLSDGNSRPPPPFPWAAKRIGRPTKNLPHQARRRDWARRTEDEMVRGVYIQHCGSERM